MVEEDEYESLPEYASTTDHMIAGAAAGILEHTIIYPVDVIKVNFNEFFKDFTENTDFKSGIWAKHRSYLIKKTVSDSKIKIYKNPKPSKTVTLQDNILKSFG